MSFTQAVQTCFSKYIDFTGRAVRSEYWWFYLFLIIVNAVINVIGSATDSSLVGVLGGLFSLAVLLPSIAVSTRRLHDIGRSGWWQLIAFTFIGIFVLIYWFVQPGEPHANAYGAPSA
jgi:uncharacterized membrane protein YhaH (DUF805 family)